MNPYLYYRVFDHNDFWSAYVLQDFSLPKPIINHLLPNSHTPIVYQKLLESCKYFYSKKTFLLLKKVSNSVSDIWVLEYFNDSRYSWNYRDAEVKKFFDKKIWITESLEISDDENLNVISKIAPKIYRCDAIQLDIADQNLFFKDFCQLTSKVKRCQIQCSLIQYEKDDNQEVAFETIFENLPSIKEFKYKFSQHSTNFTHETAKKLIQLPNFQKIDIFNLFEIPQHFDVMFIYNELKEAKMCSELTFDFRDGMPVNFQNQIIKINAEILKTKNLDFVPPIFTFRGLDFQTRKALFNFRRKKIEKLNPGIIRQKHQNVSIFNYLLSKFVTYIFLHPESLLLVIILFYAYVAYKF